MCPTVLQSTSLAYDAVTEQNVYLCTGDPLPEDIRAIVECLLTATFAVAFNSEHCVCFS